MGDHVDLVVTQFAAAHHGSFPLSVARAAGADRSHVRRRIESGRWRRLYDEVYVIAGTPRTWRRDLVAACFAGGPRAVASHGSAAELWRLPGGNTESVEITCPRWRRAKEAGMVVHESKALDDADLRLVDGIPVTSPELTLLQLGATCSPTVVEMALDRAVNTELATLGSVRQLLRRLGARGRNGAGVLRAALRERDPELAAPESPMETRVLRVFRANGLPRPFPQFEVWHHGRFVARVDFAYPEYSIAIEYESYEHHTGKLALVRDNARRNALQAVGWNVVGITAEDVRTGGASVAQTVSTLLRRVSVGFGVSGARMA